MVRDDGNVGIGTISPNAKLDISTTSGTSVFKTLDTTTVYKAFSVDYTSSFVTQLNFGLFGRFEYEGNGGVLSIMNRSAQIGSSHMRFVMGTTEHMRITDTGNVGIGTTSPSVRLHISGTSATNELVYLTGDASQGSAIRFNRGSSYSWRMGVTNVSNFTIEDTSYSTARFQISHTSVS